MINIFIQWLVIGIVGSAVGIAISLAILYVVGETVEALI